MNSIELTTSYVALMGGRGWPLCSAILWANSLQRWCTNLKLWSESEPDFRSQMRHLMPLIEAHTRQYQFKHTIIWLCSIHTTNTRNMVTQQTRTRDKMSAFASELALQSNFLKRSKGESMKSIIYMICLK